MYYGFMEPVSGKQVMCGVQTEHCSSKGCQADHRSYGLARVSLFVAAGIMVPRVQQHSMRERQAVNPRQAGLQ